MKLSLFVQPAHRPGHPSLLEELDAFSRQYIAACRCTDVRLAAHAASIEPDHATRAVHATAIVDGNVPDFVQLVPAGVFTGVDGRGPYQVRDLAACIAASKERAAQLAGMPIDYGHAMEVDLFGPAAMGAEAAGWIVDLQERDGSIWGKVEWTAAAAEKIKNREYRGLSPVFYHDAEGVVLWIARAGLTNTPNLRIKSLNSQTQHQEKSVTPEMKAFLARMAALLGLSADTASEDAIIARCSAAAEAESQFVKVAQGLSLAKTATGDDVMKAVQAAQSPDPAKFVTMDQFKAVAAQLETLRKADSERVVDDAVKAGKITPAQREHFVGWHSRDADGAKAFLEKAVPVVKPGTETRSEHGATTTAPLNDNDKAVCAMLDIKPADFAKNISQGES